MSFVEKNDTEPIYEYASDPMQLDAEQLKDLVTFVNVDGLQENLIVVSTGHVHQNYTFLQNGIENTFTNCSEALGC